MSAACAAMRRTRFTETRRELLSKSDAANYWAFTVSALCCCWVSKVRGNCACWFASGRVWEMGWSCFKKCIAHLKSMFKSLSQEDLLWLAVRLAVMNVPECCARASSSQGSFAACVPHWSPRALCVQNICSSGCADFLKMHLRANYGCYVYLVRTTATCVASYIMMNFIMEFAMLVCCW